MTSFKENYLAQLLQSFWSLSLIQLFANTELLPGTRINVTHVSCFPVSNPIHFLAKSVGVHTYSIITVSWMTGRVGGISWVEKKNKLQRVKEGREGGAVGKFPVTFCTRVAMTSFLYNKETSSTLWKDSIKIQSLFIHCVYKISIHQ
jgi:hypothetical protein